MATRSWLCAALPILLALSRHTTCQDGTDYFYGPVERSFAQVQPQLFPTTNQQQKYYERQEVNKYSDGSQAGLPSPNYNQNPSPFQLPTGRSQSGQFYLNQPDYSTVQKSRFRQALPANFQYAHPASTYRPDNSHIHSLAYQHDPSRPETFLGQITLNNPDTDYLPSNGFKNQFDSNSLRHGNYKAPVDEDDDKSNDDLFRDHRVTTYNPTRQNNKKHGSTPTRTRLDYFEHKLNTDDYDNDFGDKFKFRTLAPTVMSTNLEYKPTTFRVPILSIQNRAKPYIHPASTTEHKGLYELGPLLEEEIDEESYEEFLKQSQRGSNDVQIIKSEANSSDKHHISYEEKFDSNPSASSMNASNVVKNVNLPNSTPSSPEQTNSKHVLNNDNKHTSENELKTSEPLKTHNEETVDRDLNKNQTEDIQYEDYEEYDSYESSESPQSSEATQDAVEEYVDEPVHSDKEENTDQIQEVTEKQTHTTVLSKDFEVVTIKPSSAMVKDDNFKEFIDTTLMDHDDKATTEDITHDDGLNYPTTDSPTILRQEVVSVVTTKSVVNGTISVPDVTFAPITTKTSESKYKDEPESSSISSTSSVTELSTSKTTTTTENWVIASVQTSRSVSGARFLPFPTVEQEEKKQVIDDEDEAQTTKDPQSSQSNNMKDMSSTESINDKLDSIQSELSSSVLSGTYKDNDKSFAVITATEKEYPITTTASTPLKLFTVRTTPTTSTTEKSAPEPLPVLIKKFGYNSRPSTTSTERPKSKPAYVTIKVDDLSGLLPAGYKPRTSFKDRKKNNTSTTPLFTTTSPTPYSAEHSINATQGRSSGLTNKNQVIIQKDLAGPLPKDVKLAAKDKPSQLEDIFSKFKSEDISKFLPPGFNVNISITTESPKNVTKNIFDKSGSLDISKFLPNNYSKSTTTIRPKTQKFTTIADKVDLSAFLPKGFKLDKNISDEKSVIKQVKITDVSSLLPPGYNASVNITEEKLANPKDNSSEPIMTITENESTSKPNSGYKVVFPSRPGSNKPARKSVSTKPSGISGPVTLSPTIHKGWPIRASTEFTGWPSPSTTPFSIEKLLEAQRNATATTPASQPTSEATTHRATTTTTTTTPAPPPPTTPGVCRRDCDIAATIKIVHGVEWVPELLDHHTDEWKRLAEEVKDELNSVYSKSEELKKWYKGIRIDAFSKGSVLVDYFVELHDVGERLDTLELKQMFHKTLGEARPAPAFDPDAMLGDQPEEDRQKVEPTGKSTAKLEIGKFVVDPAFTEFIVLPKRHEPAVSQAEEDAFLPQWGIAVIVIALASLLFVVIFGVTVLVNRQKSAKAKQPIPLSEDMLRELDKSHMGGYDDLHLKERELPYPPSSKRRLSTTLVEPPYGGAAGDSWRSEWTPQLQQYMQQHYTPDSGRGSQIYGAYPYGYTGSQLYGQSGGGGGGGGSLYGYPGEYPPHPRSYSRRRSEFEANF